MNRQSKQRRGFLAVVGLLALLGAGGPMISSFQWFNQPFPGFLLYDNQVVAPNFLPHWTGQKQRLEFFDRVMAIQGRPVTDAGSVYEEVRRHPPGHSFQYDVERDGVISHVLIPSMRFSFNDWFLSFGVYLITGLGFLAIGCTPFYLRSSAAAAAPLFLMVSAIFLWFVTTFDFMTTHFFPKEIKIFAITLTSATGIHLGLRLTQRAREGKKHLLPLVFVYGLSLVLGLVCSLTFYDFPGLWRWALRASYAYSCLAAIIFLALLGSALRRSISTLETLRLRVIFAGAVLGFFLPTLGAVLTSSFHREISFNFLLIPTLFFPLSVTYALLKYSLFDIGSVLKVGLSRGLLTGVLLLAYISLVSVLSISTGLYEQDFSVPLLFSILVVLIFNPLLRWTERVVDRYVYPKEYDSNELQKEVGLLLRSLSRPRSVAENFLKAVAKAIGIEHSRLFFLAEEDDPFEVSLDGKDIGRKEIASELARCWTRHHATDRRVLAKEEIERDSKPQGQRNELLTLFGELKAELVIPISFEETVRGFISLGKKCSGRDFSAEDVRVLCSLTDHLALALENGVLYDDSEKAKEKYQLLYDQSELLNKRLVETDRLKKHFVANISHELRTPLSAILGYTEVLSDQAFAGNKQEVLDRIAAHGQDLSQLMDSLLDFSRIEAGAMTSTRQPVNIKETFGQLEIMARRLIRERPIRFGVHIGSTVDVIETDPKKLHQILLQLLTNALKFTEKGEISLEIRLLDKSPVLSVEILVSDTGIGIDERNQEAIFEDFRQLDGSSTRRFGGTGVGLSLCRKLAESLGGKIKVKSKVGEGSVFSLTLPLRRPELATISDLRIVGVQ
jgi:signal transduction histidine kinase